MAIDTAQPDEMLAAIAARPVLVPLKRKLYTGSGGIEQAPLVVIDLTTRSGIVGRSYLFAISPVNLKPLCELLHGLFGLVKGAALAPRDINETLRRRMALPGTHGLVGMAIAGIDMAAWDALGHARGLPLATLLGGTTKAVPGYNSNGLSIMAPEKVAEEALELVAEGGFSAVKLRLGRPDAAGDLAAIRAARKALPEGITLMCDFNQALDLPEALRRARMIDAEDCLLWIEEPIRADDFAGCARLAQEARTAIQIGENFSSPQQMAAALAQGACDFVMPDVQRILGVTGWLHAAGLAAAAEVPCSSHLFPEFSAHLLAVTPTRHFLEYMDWSNPLLAEKHAIKNGVFQIPSRPGAGIAWDEAAVERFRIDR